MKNLMKGKVPKTESDIVQEKHEQDMIKRQSYKPTEELIRAVSKKV